jgi:hypothetical protein
VDWTLQPSESGGETELCPAGTFPAVVVGVIDLGTHYVQTNREKNEWGDRRKLALVYQLGYPKTDGSPFMFAESLTASLHEKATLAKRIESIVGSATGDLTQLLGRQCAVSIAHSKGSRGDRDFANLDNVGQPPWGSQPVPPARQPILWRCDVGAPLPDLSWAPRIFSDSIPGCVAKSHEAKAGKIPGVTASAAPPAQQAPPPAQQQAAPTHPGLPAALGHPILANYGMQPDGSPIQQPAAPAHPGYAPMQSPPAQAGLPMQAAPAPSPQQYQPPAAPNGAPPAQTWQQGPQPFPPGVPTQFEQPGANGSPF